MTDAATIEILGREKYLRLTTFKKDSTPVPTPVWVTRDGDALIVITSATTGKVKRLAHTSRVLLAPCDARGRVKPGALDHEAVATVDSSAAAVATTTRLMKQRYGVQYTIAGFVNRLRGHGFDNAVQIRITLPSD